MRILWLLWNWQIQLGLVWSRSGVFGVQLYHISQHFICIVVLNQSFRVAITKFQAHLVCFKHYNTRFGSEIRYNTYSSTNLNWRLGLYLKPQIKRFFRCNTQLTTKVYLTWTRIVSQSQFQFDWFDSAERTRIHANCKFQLKFEIVLLLAAITMNTKVHV